MNYKGVDFTLVESTTRGVWRYQFQIGSRIKSGRIEARLDLLAVRRMHERIARELRAIGRSPGPAQ